MTGTSSAAGFSVALSPGAAARYVVRGTLTRPPVSPRPALLLLLHGGVYHRSYWDPAYRPEIYSFVRWATRAGYVTLALDRIGSGASDRPPANEVTFPANAYVVHQVASQLRGQWPTIVLVGHSMGSHTSILESAP